jgi:dihydrodipicolinate synthase/N-acetylneuraminate lyase
MANGDLPVVKDGYGSQKFCPILKSKCRDNCTLMKNDECLLALGLMGMESLGSAFSNIDPEEMSAVVQFLSAFNEAPILRETENGDIPMLHVGIDWIAD